MKIIKLPYPQIPQLTSSDLAYIEEVTALRPFYKYPVSIESFRQVIKDKKQEPTDRKTLVQVLKSQYANLSPGVLTLENIDKLADEKTFTLVTAHQPSLFTGPLYYIFKIVSVINLAKQLRAACPDFHFVPVFLTSGEDHDFAEVNHVHLFGKTLTWESGESGPVGQMKTASLKPVLEELKTMLGTSEEAAKLYGLLEKTHTRHSRYADAAFELAHELFREDGLVALNTNDARLKRIFVPIIKGEVLQQPSHSVVNQTIAQLGAAGFPSQASPRDINFFYIGEQMRERIVQEDGQFKVLNTSLSFSPAEMEAEIESHPERFSPNVIMRPIFQEKILPNLAYIGGGGELAYWLERKALFEHFGINFPMLVRRNSALWIDPASAKKMEKLGLSVEDLWADSEGLVKIYLKKNAETEFALTQEKQDLEAVFSAIVQKTSSVDQTLVGTVWAEHSKALKSLEQLETKLMRAEKQKHETAIQQVRALKEKLFPGGGLQERYENFIPFYLKHGEAFFQVLKDSFDPLEKKFVVLIS
ncbi:MAG: bacillithiol biosynthesis cysteine-adding enzyme BshC [Bacteroidetes bacterium]|nr:bacillithiol biosynthesis cysteine-adding enzyme BshC [Bacteroidota bacterium]